MRRLLPLLLASCGLLSAQEATPSSFSVTNDFTYQRNDLAYQQPRDGQTEARPAPGQYQEALSVFGSYGDWSAGFTLRAVNFFLQDANTTLEEPQKRLHRKFLKFHHGSWELQGGDFYAMLGRGLVLSIMQNDKTLRERTLEGGEFQYSGNRFSFRALGGKVQTETFDQAWRVYGAEAEVAWWGRNRIGARASLVQDAEGKDPYRTQYTDRVAGSWSASGSELLGAFSYYGETARLRYKDPNPDGSDALKVKGADGEGDYGNLGLHVGGLTLQAEYKRYLHFDTGLNNAPLADRDDEKPNLEDTEGYRLLTQYSFRDPDLQVYVSAGRYREYRQRGNAFYGGFVLDDVLRGHLSLSAQWGIRRLVPMSGVPVAYSGEKKTDALLTWRFDPAWSLQLTLKDKRYRDGSYFFLQKDYMAQLGRAPWGAVWVLWQYSQDPIRELGNSRVMVSGGVRVSFRKGSFVELSGGKLRGGEVCGGGQCIFLPPFQGWKVATHIQF